MNAGRARRQQRTESLLRGALGLALALGVLWAIAGHDAQLPPPALVAPQG